MQPVTIDPALVEKLGQLPGHAILCDAEGHALGHFRPFKDRPLFEDLQLEPSLSIEETEALRKQGRTGKPLEEILRNLGFE